MNGTVSGISENIEVYKKEMEKPFVIIRKNHNHNYDEKCQHENEQNEQENEKCQHENEQNEKCEHISNKNDGIKKVFLFAKMDWKESNPIRSDWEESNTMKVMSKENDPTPDFQEKEDEDEEKKNLDPFPDFRVKIVKQLVSCGGGDFSSTSTSSTSCKNSKAMKYNLAKFKGEHVTPEKWHQMLQSPDEDLVLFDVRNRFEYAVGRFKDAAGREALQPWWVFFLGF